MHDRRKVMTTHRLLAPTTTALIMALAACASGVRVRTAVSPDAKLNTLHTLQVLPTPEPRAARPEDANDPMLVNSITNRALRDYLVQGFQARGYIPVDSNPDFAVAYYASTKEKLDVTYWDYGYAWEPYWWGGVGWGPVDPTVTKYTEGTVILDVIDPRTKELLWRGSGVARVSDDVQEYEQELRKTVMAILEKFPPAQPGAWPPPPPPPASQQPR
jgi:hypothetical protein